MGCFTGLIADALVKAYVKLNVKTKVKILYRSAWHKGHKEGFSIVEVSILVAVVAIISIGLVLTYPISKKAEKVERVQEQLDKIEGAIKSYYQMHDKLPCPASFRTTQDDSFGRQYREDTRGGQCGDWSLDPECKCAVTSGGVLDSNHYLEINTSAGTVQMGMVPIRDLGLDDNYAIDPWGNRIMYVTALEYGSADNSSPRNFKNKSSLGGSYGGIIIRDLNGNNAHNGDEKPGYVLISYGSNGPAVNKWGRDRSGTFPCTGTGTRYANCNLNNAIFVDDHVTVTDGDEDNSFRNYTRWKTIDDIAKEETVFIPPNNISDEVSIIVSNDETSFCRSTSNKPFVDESVVIRGAGTVDAINIFISSGTVQSDDELQMEGATASVSGDQTTYTGGGIPGGIDVVYDSDISTLSMKIASGVTSGTYDKDVWQSLIRKVVFYNPSIEDLTDTSEEIRTIYLSLGDLLGFLIDGKVHYYEFIAQDGISWNSAKSAAANKTYEGLQGYLAVITSEAENNFIKSKIRKPDGSVPRGWIGCRRSSNKWKWDVGPEAGTKFWNGNAGGSPISGRYSNWKSGEPNDQGGSEDYGHLLGNGTWNDFPQDGYDGQPWEVKGYVVEYGGFDDDPILNVSESVNLTIRLCT